MQTNAHILSTIELPQPVLDKAAANGVSIDVVPFIETIALPARALKASIDDLSAKHTTVVFTSAKAVDAVASVMNEPSWDIYCIDGNTMQAVEKHFSHSSIKATATNAATLAAEILNRAPAAAITFFCGNLRRDELPDILKQAGLAVHEITVYETIILKKEINKPYNAILFASPSAVEGYFSVNSLPANTTCFAIGNTTADAIKKYTDNNIIVAAKADKEELAMQAINYFATATVK
jgi:uroporphyrinogen-III synthase